MASGNYQSPSSGVAMTTYSTAANCYWKSSRQCSIHGGCRRAPRDEQCPYLVSGRDGYLPALGWTPIIAAEIGAMTIGKFKVRQEWRHFDWALSPVSWGAYAAPDATIALPLLLPNHISDCWFLRR